MAPRKKATKKAATRNPSPTTKKRGTKRGKKSQGFDEAAGSLDKAWGKSKTSAATGGRNFGPNMNVPDGNYVARISGAKTGVPKNGGEPYFRITYVILGELDGEKVQSYDELSDVEAFDGKTRLDLASERLQACGIDTEKIKSLRELPKVAEQMTKKGQHIHIGIQNNHVTAEESNDGKPHDYQRVYVNEVISNAELEDVLAEL